LENFKNNYKASSKPPKKPVTIPRLDIKKAEIFRFEDSPKSKPQSEDKYFEANKPLTPTIGTQ
jgi:hypothetical protein